MSDINWDLAADGTAESLVTCEDAIYWFKEGHIWHNNGGYWVKSDPDFLFLTIATRPQPEQPLNWNNMKEGMKVVFNGFTNTMHTHWEFEEGNVYVVSRHKCGALGPLSGSGCVPSENYGFDFSVIGEPERKTVEDAVAQLGNATFPVAATHIGVAKISQGGWLEKGQFEFVGQNCDKNIFDLFCTIEEFEACVAAKAAKSEPEWTHRTKHGELCRIVLEDPDTDGYIVVLTEGNEYVKHHTALIPIKPTISKSEAWDRCIEEFGVRNIKYVMQDLMDEFDITN